jgi:hypothetical protein
MNSDVVRAKTATGDWCKPTAELPNHDLAQLLHRARRESDVIVLGEADRKAVPELTDAWFQDSEPVTTDEAAVIVDRPPVADPAPRVPSPPVLPAARHDELSVRPRGRYPREAIKRITDRLVKLTAPHPVVYPVAPTSYAWVWPAVVAVVSAITIGVAVVRPF